MRKARFLAGRTLIVVLIGLLAGLFAACSSSEEQADAQADQATDATAQATDQKQTTYGRAVQRAEDTVAELANPKVNTDPVCGMAVDETSIIVTIADKDYAVCSERCAETLQADPDKYLVASAGEDGHEGHNH